MKIKIGTIFVCMLLFSSTTTLAFTQLSKNKQETKNQFFDTTVITLPKSNGWIKTFGGEYRDFGESVQQTNDEGYIITGYTESLGTGGWDVWLIKTNKNGNKMWDKTFGGTNDDCSYYVQQTNDNGYIIIGWTESYSYYRNIWMIKTDSNGNKIWEKTFGSTNFSMGLAVQQTADGGYILVGQILSDISFMDVLLVKTDGNGNEEWNRTFGGIEDEQGFSVQQTIDGGYIITGQTMSFGTGAQDVWLIKTDNNGIELWNKTFGGQNHDYSFGLSVKQTSDDGYIIVGDTLSFLTGSVDVWLIKTDSNGDKQWDQIFGGTSTDEGNSVQQTTDGGYIIGGNTWSFGIGGINVWLIKTDSYGNKLWDRTFGLLGYCRSVQQTTDGGYIIAGYTESNFNNDVLLIKTNSKGKLKTTLSNHLCLQRLFWRLPNAFSLLKHLLE